jgi:hypothetical protein
MGLKNLNGWAICPSNERDCDVYTFWSDKAYAKRHCNGPWANYKQAERRGEDYPEFEEHEEQPRHTTPAPSNQHTEKLKSIVERIQIGDAEEGLSAIQDLTQVVHQGIQIAACPCLR